MLLFYFLCNQCHFAVGGALLFTLYKDGIKAKRPFKSLLYLTAIHEWVWIITCIQKRCSPPPIGFMNAVHPYLINFTATLRGQSYRLYFSE